ncbi:putative quinol monooxygenase [Blastomonas sp.]|uniref:putative quinol monooxygenase n=1 Tax=Blastomonas sp. TaxID=1909299 RepID=UPI00359325CE
MLIIEGWVRFAPGELDKLTQVTAIMIAETLKEPGCLHYSFARDMVDPDLMRISERWDSQEALDAHSTAPHMAAFGAGLAQVERLGADLRLYSGDEIKRIM